MANREKQKIRYSKGKINNSLQVIYLWIVLQKKQNFFLVNI